MNRVANAPNRNAAFALAFVQELTRAGVTHLCACPGSRSTPLLVAATQMPGIELWMHLDERAAAFFALGLAKATRAPVALLCTSGTAAANFLPAIVEAYHSRVPLIVLTADRPAELRDCGAGQTIDQLRIFGSHARWFAEAPLPEASNEVLRAVRKLACRAVFEATSHPRGPVHLNFPFREPLEPKFIDGDLASDLDALALNGRAPKPFCVATPAQVQASETSIAELVDWIAREPQGIIACGPLDLDPTLSGVISKLGQLAGWPIFADPTAQLRCGPHTSGAPVIATADALLRDADFATEHAPRAVLRLGDFPTSKAFKLWLEAHPEAHSVVIDPEAAWHDPSHLAHTLIAVDPDPLLAELVTRLAAQLPRARQSVWLDDFLASDACARSAIADAVREDERILEPRFVQELEALLPEQAALFVSSSMPVRDLDAFLPASKKKLRVLCNRGANGIDGILSSALGASAALDAPTMLVVGDLAFLHDLSGLFAAARHSLDLLIFVLQNNGGGIFSYLPIAQHDAKRSTQERDMAIDFDALFTTPHDLDLRPFVEGFGGKYAKVTSWPEFRKLTRDALQGKGLRVIEIPVDLEASVAAHRAISKRISEALAKRTAKRSAAKPTRDALNRNASKVAKPAHGASSRAAEFTELTEHFLDVDGVRLHVETRGDGTPVVLLHGLTGCARSMQPLTAALTGYRCICIDLLGHGKSEHPESTTPYSVEACLRQLHAALNRLRVDAAHWLGYSMGGRIALAFAVANPKRALSLTTIGASAGIACARERAARHEADAALADAILRDGIEAFVEHWSKLPLFASQQKYLSHEAREALRQQRLANSAQGLAGSLRGCGTGVQEPLHQKLSTLTMPVLLCAGEEDAKFRAIAQELAATIPHAQTAVIPRAGHAAHLENPNAFLDLWKKFLASATEKTSSRKSTLARRKP